MVRADPRVLASWVAIVAWLLHAAYVAAVYLPRAVGYEVGFTWLAINVSLAVAVVTGALHFATRRWTWPHHALFAMHLLLAVLMVLLGAAAIRAGPSVDDLPAFALAAASMWVAAAAR